MSVAFAIACYASLALSLIHFRIVAYPHLRESRRFYEAHRVIHCGYTLPLMISCLWWAGLQERAPRWTRKHPDPIAAQRWLDGYYEKLRVKYGRT